MNSSWIRTEKNSYLIPKIRTCLVTTYVLQGYLQDSCSRYKFILGNKRWVTKIRVFGSNISWTFLPSHLKKITLSFLTLWIFSPQNNISKISLSKIVGNFLIPVQFFILLPTSLFGKINRISPRLTIYLCQMIKWAALFLLHWIAILHCTVKSII